MVILPASLLRTPNWRRDIQLSIMTFAPCVVLWRPRTTRGCPIDGTATRGCANDGSGSMDAGCSKPRFRLAAHCLGWEFKGITRRISVDTANLLTSVFSGDEFTHLGNQLLTVLHGIWNRVVATDEQARCSELIIPQHRFGNRIQRPTSAVEFRVRLPQSRVPCTGTNRVHGCSCRVQKRCEPTFCGVSTVRQPGLNTL